VPARDTITLQDKSLSTVFRGSAKARFKNLEVIRLSSFAGLCSMIKTWMRNVSPKGLAKVGSAAARRASRCKDSLIQSLEGVYDEENSRLGRKVEMSDIPTAGVILHYFLGGQIVHHSFPGHGKSYF
jgi:hypothetical protein